MSLGTLFVDPKSSGVCPEAIVKYLKLDIKISGRNDPIYEENFPAKKISAFINPEGYKLTEVIAILIYLITLHDEKSSLLGKNKKEFASILEWLSFSTCELLPTAAKAFGPLVGKERYNKSQVDTALVATEKLAQELESRLSKATYLVGDDVTIADVFTATVVGRIFETVWAQDFISEHPGITNWFTTMQNGEILSPTRFGSSFQFRNLPLQPPVTKPRRKQKQEKPKGAAKSFVTHPEVGFSQRKHPIKLALGKPSLTLVEWKRCYSNEPTSVSIPWFWDHYDPTGDSLYISYDAREWSFYKVEYKYNQELTKTFMSLNLLTGFFYRLEPSVNYLFGCMVVYGEDDNNGIIGAFFIRGQDFKPAFDVAPDWDLYDYTKLNPDDDLDKNFINNMWTWDDPVIIDGQAREIVDGRVFK